MKKLIVSALVAASVLSAPGVVFTTAANAATPCGPDAPEALRRPGGYCELLGQGTLASTGELPAAAPIVEPVDEAPAENF